MNKLATKEDYLKNTLKCMNKKKYVFADEIQNRINQVILPTRVQTMQLPYPIYNKTKASHHIKASKYK